MRSRVFVLGVTLAAALGAASCASSSKQSESDDSNATASSSDEPTSSDSSNASDTSDSSDSSDSSDAKPDHPVVTLESLIGSEVDGGEMPEGCPGEWKPLEGRKFDGKLYSCSGFHAAHRYKEPTIVIGIREGTIRRVNLQSFHEPGEGIEEMYATVTDDYQSRCDRNGGAGSRMRLKCDDYLVAIRMQRNGGMLNIVYALKNWDLQY